MNMHRTITLIAALAVTGLAMAMAFAAADVRSVTPVAAGITAGAGVFAVFLAHCGPALLRTTPRLVLWPCWAVALAASLWAHATFLTATAADAGAARQAASPAAAAAAAQRAAVEQALAGIKARPAGTIVRQLPYATDPDRQAALQAELQEARRADALREQLIVLAGAATAAATSAAADPLTVWVAGALDVTAGAVQLTFALLVALLMELAGMLLWREFAAGRTSPESTSTPAQPAAPAAQAAVHQVLQVNVHSTTPAAPQLVQEIVQPVVQQIEQTPVLFEERDLDQVRRAIARGDCNKTVESIRTYLACSSSKARSLRRALLDA